MAHLKIRPFSDTDLHQEEICQAVYEEAPKNGFWYPAVSHAGQKLKKGTLLGTLKDIYGNEIFRCTAPFDGVVLYYTLSLGVKCKDPLIAFARFNIYFAGVGFTHKHALARSTVCYRRRFVR